MNHCQLFMQAIERTHFMALSTSNNNKPWVCPVYFIYDADLNLYFRSSLSTRHMKNIRANNRVAIAIYPGSSLPGHKVAGIQIDGVAQLVDAKKRNQVTDLYFARVDPTLIGKPAHAQRYFAETADWSWVQVKPTEVYYMDNRYFKYERQPVDLEKLKSLPIKSAA